MRVFIFCILMLVTGSASAGLATLVVSSDDGEGVTTTAPVEWISGEENPLLCEVAEHRLDLIEDISKKIRYLHNRITANIERWRHRRYLDEIARLEQQLEFNFNYLNKREIVLKATWDLGDFSEDIQDKIYFEQLNSSLVSPVLTLQSFGNLYYPQELVQIHVDKAVDGVLPITLMPSLQEYCSGPMDLILEIEII